MHRAFGTASRHKAFTRATGLLIGTWGLTYTLTKPPIHLDVARRHKDGSTKPGLITESLVARQKPVSSFDGYRKPDVDAKLREFEQAHKAPPGAGISEYHVSETTRYFRSLL